MRHALFLCLCFVATVRSISNCVCLPSVILARVFHQKHGVTSTKEAYRVTVFPEYCKSCNREEGENVIELLPPPTRRGSTEENINCEENQQLYCTTHTRVLIKLFTPLLRAAKQSKWNNNSITICISIDESNDYSLKARSTRRMRDLCF